MAILNIVKNRYDTENVHGSLIHYAMYPKVYDETGKNTGTNEMAVYYGGNNLFLGTPETAATYAAEQMDAALQMTGKDYGQCLKHLILSFDSEGSERHITPADAGRMAEQICTDYLPEYQTFFAVHENRPSHLHIHFIINGVNLQNGYKFPDKKKTYFALKDNISKMPDLQKCELAYGSQSQQ